MKIALALILFLACFMLLWLALALLGDHISRRQHEWKHGASNSGKRKN